MAVEHVGANHHRQPRITFARFLDNDAPRRAGAFRGEHRLRHLIGKFVCVHAPSFARRHRMAYETIDFNDGADRADHAQPTRPAQQLHAQMHDELRDALASLGDARVVVLTGAGRGFCAGQDLNDRAVAPGEAGRSWRDGRNELEPADPHPDEPAAARHRPRNGVAAGAGANIALACDLVVAAKSAKFIQSFSAIGLIPDTGGTWILPRLVGQARALGLALTGEPILPKRPPNGD